MQTHAGSVSGPRSRARALSPSLPPSLLPSLSPIKFADEFRFQEMRLVTIRSPKTGNLVCVCVCVCVKVGGSERGELGKGRRLNRGGDFWTV